MEWHTPEIPALRGGQGGGQPGLQGQKTKQNKQTKSQNTKQKTQKPVNISKCNIQRKLPLKNENKIKTFSDKRTTDCTASRPVLKKLLLIFLK